MIRKLTACLTTILDEAVDDGHLERNPARSRRMRVKVPKPARTFLEMRARRADRHRRRTGSQVRSTETPPDARTGIDRRDAGLRCSARRRPMPLGQEPTLR